MSFALRAAAGAPAVAALVAASVARHDAAAFRAQRRIGTYALERQRLLRIGLGRPERHSLTRLRHRIFRAQELRAQPTENVIHDRLGIRNLLIPCPAARLKAQVRELVDQEL
jgi:hypothetical protein